MTPAGLPRVELLDAQGPTLDGPGLRRQARALCEAYSRGFCSRSYRYPLALVATHRLPVGVDIERIEPADTSFIASISTPAERNDAAEERLDRYQADLWSGKEALAKALGDALRYDPRRIESPVRWPHVKVGSAVRQCGRWRAMTVSVPIGYVGWLVWRAA